MSSLNDEIKGVIYENRSCAPFFFTKTYQRFTPPLLDQLTSSKTKSLLISNSSYGPESRELVNDLNCQLVDSSLNSHTAYFHALVSSVCQECAEEALQYISEAIEEYKKQVSEATEWYKNLKETQCYYDEERHSDKERHSDEKRYSDEETRHDLDKVYIRF